MQSPTRRRLIITTSAFLALGMASRAGAFCELAPCAPLEFCFEGEGVLVEAADVECFEPVLESPAFFLAGHGLLADRGPFGLGDAVYVEGCYGQNTLLGACSSEPFRFSSNTIAAAAAPVPLLGSAGSLLLSAMLLRSGWRGAGRPHRSVA